LFWDILYLQNEASWIFTPLDSEHLMYHIAQIKGPEVCSCEHWYLNM
jgi:hypothetical protein